ncbi:MAG TPA: hypothetical protein VMV90_09835 [Rectinemataceae bacterium]|nr:hypothetical protein [Rectinemataceae bacterium]
MNRRFLAVLAATSIAVALLSALSVAYRVYEAGAAGRKVAAVDFETLRYSLSRVRTASDLGDPVLRARLMAQYRASPDLLLAAVYERGAGLRWRIPAYSPYLPAKENVLPSPQVAYSPLSSVLLSAPLPGDPSGMLAVDALYRTVDQGTVFLAFRDALLALAIYIALAAVAIAVAAALASTRSLDVEDLDESLSSRMAAAAAEGDAAGETVMGLGDPEAEGLGESGPAREASGYASSPKEEFDIPDIASSSEDKAEEKPNGLFSPRSSLGWESYLESRLDAELQRSASFEQDLSLLLIRCGDLHGEVSPHYKAIADALAEFFTFRDLAFERGEAGFSVILPNIDAEHALRMAEEFLKKLDAHIEGIEAPSVTMGLSSRTGRLVDSVRMLGEATAALDKAKTEGGSRIVAFRPDPEKYRLYLSSKGCA